MQPPLFFHFLIHLALLSTDVEGGLYAIFDPPPSPARPGAAASSATVLVKRITSLPEDKNKGPNIHLVIGNRVAKTNLILTGLAVDPRGNLVNCASLPMTVSLLVEEKDSGGDYLSFDVPE